MKIKIIKPAESAFTYNPKNNEITVVSDLKFYFNNETASFELDQNPYGEMNLTAIRNLQYSNDFSKLNFDCIYRKKETAFNLRSIHAIDAILYKFIVEMQNKSVISNPSERDKIEIFFVKGNVTKIYTYKKDENYNLIDSLTIVKEGDDYFRIKQNPWIKIKINDSDIVDNNINFLTEDGRFIYTLEVQPAIMNVIKNLLHVSFIHTKNTPEVNY